MFVGMALFDTNYYVVLFSHSTTCYLFAQFTNGLIRTLSLSLPCYLLLSVVAVALFISIRLAGQVSSRDYCVYTCHLTLWR